jgi:A/G-specific adenine glycosylase
MVIQSLSMSSEIAILLIDWFKKEGRKFPWRKNADPYNVLIAEIMLQRTKAEQVVPIFNAFLEKYPNVKELNKASEEEISEFFTKLGLKHRAKLTKSLAKMLVCEFDSIIPTEREKLLELPAVGEYVSDALLCFSFKKRVSIIDSNVCRIISRVFKANAKGEARRDPSFRKIADGLLPDEKIREFNWALIDLASKICRPRAPKCDECPLNQRCLSRSACSSL